MSNVPGSSITLKEGYISGAQVFAKSLKNKGVKVMFGIVGIPVVEVAEACIQEGIQFIGCRNEQTASYAAGAYGYLSGKPGVCLVVSGPGVIHALSGLYNAQANCWPLILIGGSCETNQVGRGAFQELDQVNACKPYTKYSDRPNEILRIPEVLDRAFNYTLNGQPGTSYMDFPADLIKGSIPEKLISEYPSLTKFSLSCADEESTNSAAKLINQANNLLVILGKGAAYSKSENEILQFINKSGTPFITSPMGKGILPDDHENCVSSARGTAIRKADVVLILGARMNWMFQFGRQFQPTTKVIQVDIHAEELGKTRKPDISLIGHIQPIMTKLNQNIKYNPNNQTFLKQLKQISINNSIRMKKHLDVNLPLMNHHQAIQIIQNNIKHLDLVLVSEGARTMDVTRILVPSNKPRHRLDAGTLGVMGVGVGYAIAAQLVYPNKPVVAIMGDSAFGFSAMDIETCMRYSLPIIFIIINNSGIYSGLEDLSQLDLKKIPSFALSPSTEYHHLANLVKDKAYGVTVHSKQQLEKAMKNVVSGNRKLAIINVIIDPSPSDEGLNWQVKEPSSKL